MAAEGLVLVEVKALGISWPDLLQTRGQYQIKPEVPFQLGVDFAAWSAALLATPGSPGLPQVAA